MSTTLNFDKLQAMHRHYIRLWVTRAIALFLLIGNLFLAAAMAYLAFVEGIDSALSAVYSALGGAVIAAILTGYQFRHMGWFSVNFLREAKRKYESIDGDNSLAKRYRNFKRARAAKAELLK